jgi:hypothetical protein
MRLFLTWLWYRKNAAFITPQDRLACPDFLAGAHLSSAILASRRSRLRQNGNNLLGGDAVGFHDRLNDWLRQEVRNRRLPNLGVIECGS